MSTEDLQSIDGIGEKIAETLISAGIPNVISLASATVQKLVNVGIPKSKAMKILDEARERCSSIFGFVTGDELVQLFNKRQYLTTGTKGLDEILGGRGFETQKVYEIYGPEGTGKSTLVHQLICTAFLPPDQGGLGAGTIFLDTEGTFSIKRIREFAVRFGIDPDEISKNVVRANPPTSDTMLFIAEQQLDKMADQVGARLFCLDSIATHFRSEYGSERQMLPERQQKANRIIHALKRVVVAKNGVAVMTNQVTANVTGMGLPWTHSMGNVVGHESQVRIRVRKKGELREFKIEKALDLPPKICLLTMTDQGLFDEEKKPKKAKGDTADDEESETKSKEKKAAKKPAKKAFKGKKEKAEEEQEPEEAEEEPEVDLPAEPEPEE